MNSGYATPSVEGILWTELTSVISVGWDALILIVVAVEISAVSGSGELGAKLERSLDTGRVTLLAGFMMDSVDP
ncbi:hypothetical protein MJO29_016085 [Puccinia striiformis f. sp. tritici]|nr:hypothetical protein MJO29_016085 [Puccinia striiformis f. sp. tritici]